MPRERYFAHFCFSVLLLALQSLCQESKYESTIDKGLEVDIQFGGSIALSPTGKTLAVGAPDFVIGNAQGAGQVMLFERLQDKWNDEPIAILQSDEPVSLSKLGTSIALTDYMVIAGAPQEYSDKGGDTGAVYFFSKKEGTNKWDKHQDKIIGEDEKNYFGWSLNSDGTYLSVGASGYSSNAGGVFVYQFGILSLKWERIAILTVSIVDGQLGNFVALRLTFIISGAPYAKEGMGGAYLWKISDVVNNGDSAEVTSLVKNDSEFNYFGFTSAVLSETFVAVATFGPLIYFFSFSNDNWKQSTTLYAPDESTVYGCSMDFMFPLLVVGTNTNALIYSLSSSQFDDTGIELEPQNFEVFPKFGPAPVAITDNLIVVGDYSLAASQRVHSFTYSLPDIPTKMTSIIVEKNSKSQSLGQEVALLDDLAIISVPNCVDPKNPSSCDGGYLKSYQKDTSGNWEFFKILPSPFRNRDNMFGINMQTFVDYVILYVSNSNYINKDIDAFFFYVWDTENKKFTKDSVIQYRKPAGKKVMNPSISTFKNVAVIGTPDFNVFTLPKVLLNVGGVQVYRKVDKKWSKTFTINAPNLSENQRFGTSVALQDENRVAVVDNPVGSYRTIFLFNYDESTWKYTDTLPGTTDGFGWKIAFLGEILYVSDISTELNAGSISIYNGGVKNDPFILKVGTKGKRFGYSFSFDEVGSKLVVGANPCGGESVACNIRGAVYTFTKDSSTGQWTKQYRFESKKSNGLDGYGLDVAIRGDTVLVSAPFEEPNPNYGKGTAYLLQK